MDKHLVPEPPVRIHRIVSFDQVMEYIKLLDNMEQTTDVVEAKKKALLAMDQFLFPTIESEVLPLYPLNEKKGREKRWWTI